MDTVFIEATDRRQFNWGKFMVGRFTVEEWNRRSQIRLLDPKAGPEHIETYDIPEKCDDGTEIVGELVLDPMPRLLDAVGWTWPHLLVYDLQTGEGGIFKPGGYARADLEKHQIHVCPLFEPFLTWLYKQDLTDLSKLPAAVDLGEVITSLYGYRRRGRPVASCAPAGGKGEVIEEEAEVLDVGMVIVSGDGSTR